MFLQDWHSVWRMRVAAGQPSFSTVTRWVHSCLQERHRRTKRRGKMGFLKSGAFSIGFFSIRRNKLCVQNARVFSLSRSQMSLLSDICNCTSRDIRLLNQKNEEIHVFPKSDKPVRLLELPPPVLGYLKMEEGHIIPPPLYTHAENLPVDSNTPILVPKLVGDWFAKGDGKWDGPVFGPSQDDDEGTRGLILYNGQMRMLFSYPNHPTVHPAKPRYRMLPVY